MLIFTVSARSFFRNQYPKIPFSSALQVPQPGDLNARSPGLTPLLFNMLPGAIQCRPDADLMSVHCAINDAIPRIFTP